jgi:HAD superfamily hydrolase (TIGR01509 family)
MMRIALVFDMDGVLFDSHPVHRTAWRELLRGAGKEVSDVDLEFVLEGATREEILHHFLGPLTPHQAKLYAVQKEAIFRQEEDRVQLIEGLEGFLDVVDSAAIPMAVATSASRMRTSRMLENHRLANRFAAILTGDDVPGGKSSPGIYLRAAELLQARASEVLVLEDAITAVKVVKGIGMKCIGVAEGQRGPGLVLAGADLVIPNFTNLDLADVIGLFQNSAAVPRPVPTHGF